jgi:hypothetical protein
VRFFRHLHPQDLHLRYGVLERLCRGNLLRQSRYLPPAAALTSSRRSRLRDEQRARSCGPARARTCFQMRAWGR